MSIFTSRAFWICAAAVCVCAFVAPYLIGFVKFILFERRNRGGGDPFGG